MTDATDTLKASYTYDPWGKLLNPIDPLGTKDKFKFSGEALDPQTGLYYLRARFYDPQVGRFISRDALSGAAAKPVSQNRWAYALSNPISYSDPSGLAAEPNSGDSGAAISGPIFRSGAILGGTVWLISSGSGFSVSTSDSAPNGTYTPPTGSQPIRTTSTPYWPPSDIFGYSPPPVQNTPVWPISDTYIGPASPPDIFGYLNSGSNGGECSWPEHCTASGQTVPDAENPPERLFDPPPIQEIDYWGF